MRRLIALLLFAAAAPALANDGEFYGEGATVFPIGNNQIAMDREVLVIEQMGPPGDYVHHWQVSVDYTFRNTSDQPVTVQMGFPERCQRFVEDMDTAPEGPWCKRPAIKGFVAKVDGASAAITIKTPKPGQPGALDGLAYDRVHTFKVRFAPHQSRRVQHTYRHHGAITSPWHSHVDYITVTGALWKGPIGDFDFKLVLKEKFKRFQSLQSKDNPFPEPTSKGTEGAYTVWRWQLKDFEPKGNPALLFGEPAHIVRGELITDLQLAHDTPAKLAKLDRAALRLMRNTVYAAYGYRFKSADLAQHFGAQPWYVPRDDYDPAWLSAQDLKFVAAIKQAEKTK